MKIFAIIFVALLVGCTNTGVVPIGQDTFMISQSGGTFSGGALKADCYREGQAYCAKLGKEFQPVKEHSEDWRPGRNGSAELHFRCLSKGDAELSRPTMKPLANVRIESDMREKKEIQVQQPNDIYSELKKLKELLDAGVITQAEFDKQKAKILNN